MRKLGFVMPFMIAAVAVFGADAEKAAPAAKKAPEVKAEEKKAAAPAEAKPAEKKVEEKKAEAPAPAAAEVKVEAPIDTPIPWFVPAKSEELESGMEFKVPAEGTRTKADMKPGESRSLLLKENAGGTWIVSAVNAKVATVKQIAKDGAWVTFEITAIHTGRTLLEMSQVDRRNAPLRAFRCYIEVK
ncbi:MAG: hypothetical protein J6Y54_06565 [Lentisphaeria bacterium]|nr:hypothetical protein [Lentisphaeria bacterium]